MTSPNVTGSAPPESVAVAGDPATRGPAVGLACRNCGAALHGAFCAQCGQEDRPLDPSLRDIVADAWDAITNLDGKVVRSLRVLVAQPGVLTTEYLAGRRARYLSPFRLYLLCSVAFFFVGAIDLDGEDGMQRAREAAAVDSLAAARSAPDTTGPAVSATAAFEQRLHRGNARLKASGGSLSGTIRDNVPNAMFVIMPLYAALVHLLYRSRRRRFPAHLVFALHMHAFFFAVLTISGLSDLLREAAMLPGRVDSALGLLVLAALLVYYPVAMRRVYGGRWGPTILRAFILGNAYSLVTLLLLAGITVGYVYVLGG